MSEKSEKSCSKNWVLGTLKGQQTVLGKMANVCPDLKEDFEDLIVWLDGLRRRVETTTVIEAMPMTARHEQTTRLLGGVPKAKAKRIFAR